MPNSPSTLKDFSDLEEQIEQAYAMPDGMIVSKTGVRQSRVRERLDLIPPEVTLLLGQCLAYGAETHGEDNWKSADTTEDHVINVKDNLNHALIHINKFLMNDQEEPHLVNAMARISFALWHAVQSGQQDPNYIR